MKQSQRISRRRARRFGLLGLLSASLAPAGKIIAGSAAAALLLGGVATQFRPHAGSSQVLETTSGEAGVRLPAAGSEPRPPHQVQVEHAGQELTLILTAGEREGDGALDTFTPGTFPLSSPASTGRGGKRLAHAGPFPGEIGAGPQRDPADNSPPSQPPLAKNTPERLAPAVPPSSVNDEPPGAPGVGVGVDGHPDEIHGPGGPAGKKEDDMRKPGGNAPPETAGDLPQSGNPPGPLAEHGLTSSPAAVPEPSMMGLLLLGAAAMAWVGRRRPVARGPR